MMGKKRKTYHRNARGAETQIVGKTNFLIKCAPEARKLLRLVKRKNFTTDVKAQKEVALLFRGIHMKMRGLDAWAAIHDYSDLPGFMEIIKELRQEYSQVFNRIPIDLEIETPLVLKVIYDDSNGSDEGEH